MFNEQDFDNWQKLKEKLAIAKKAELGARLKVCEAMFGTREGEFSVTEETLSIGRTVKATSKLNRNVDWEELGFDKDDFQSEARQLLADYLDITDAELALIDIKISLNDSRYKKAKDVAKNIEEAMMVTPGTPTLEVKFTD